MPEDAHLNPFTRLFRKKTHVAQAELRRAGDQARDARRWSEAAAHYATYLAHIPGDAKIHVQRGNCLKEAGRLTEALTAYDAAIELDNQDPDSYLQRGHLMKLMGRPREAANQYRRSFELNPHGNQAFGELIALGIAAEPAAVPAEAAERPAAVEPASLGPNEIIEDGPVIYVDITDLADYLRVNVSLSGIQRVVANIMTNAAVFSQQHGGGHVRPVLPDYNGSSVYTVKMNLLEGLLGIVAGGRGGHEAISRALDLMMESRTAINLRPGDTFLIAGAFWIYHRYDLLNMMRQNGVRVSIFVHDLIQITNPEYVEPKATTIFRRAFVDVLSVTSYILTNSHFVAADVRRYIAERMNFHIPVTPVTLATELSSAAIDNSLVHQEYHNLVTEQYVLCVATIEIRKNHMYLIRIWERMIAEGVENIPNLVFVGKWGWEIDDLRKHLADSDYLGGRLFIYNGISDQDLGFLYQHCMFTVYPSFAEGWGLPVGESLNYGRPCIASKVTSIPEVGGELCKYIDPFDLEDGYRVITGVLADRPGLEAWTQHLRATFRPKTWEVFTLELLQTVKKYGEDKTLDRYGNNVLLESGEIAYMGNDPLEQEDRKKRKLVTARMARISGWHGLEAWGCWTSRRRAVLRFYTRMQPGTEATVYLFLKTADGDVTADCSIKIGDRSTFVDDLGPASRWCTASGPVGEHGALEVTIVSGHGFYHRHGRELYAGVMAVAVAPTHDAALRFQVLERIVPGGVPPRQLPARMDTAAE